MDDQSLRAFFKFDEADLNANRSGRLSQKQQRDLVKLRKGHQKFFTGLGLALLVIASISPLVYKKFDTGTIVWVVIWGVFGCLSLIRTLTFKFDFSKNKVKRIEGPLHVVEGTGRDWNNHYLHIGKEQYEVDEKLAGCIHQGDTYAFYFESIDGEAGAILSAEWLESAAYKKNKPVAAAVPDPGQPVSDPNAPVAQGNYCTNCGSPNPAGSRFCNKCGKALPD